MHPLTPFALPFAVSEPALSQQTKATSLGPGVSMERYEGGSVVTDLGYDIRLNKGSTLKREWFVARDEAAPLSIEGSAGVAVLFKSGERYTSGQFEYEAQYRLRAREAISAFEVRLIVLDVFGRPLKTLSATHVTDFSDESVYIDNWRIWGEGEASEAFASVAYVAQARTTTGHVYEVDRSAVLEQIRKVAKRITETDLEPTREASA